MQRIAPFASTVLLHALAVHAVHAEAPPGRYSSTAETVLDTRTTLTWQRVVAPESYVQSAAVSYCASLILAGHTDWRLPTRAELLSLVDPTRANPAIDITAFPGTPLTSFWTASTYAPQPMNAWRVDFGRGAVTQATSDQQFRVRCVR